MDYIEVLYDKEKDVSSSDLTTDKLSLGNTKETSYGDIISSDTENSQENLKKIKKHKLQDTDTDRESFAEYVARIVFLSLRHVGCVKGICYDF